MTPWWWSVLLAAIGIVGLVLAGYKRPSGWLVGIAAQVLWIVYAAVSGQWGFYLSAVAYGVVYGLNYWRWLREPLESVSARYRRHEPELQQRWDDGYRAGQAEAWKAGATMQVWPKHDEEGSE